MNISRRFWLAGLVVMIAAATATSVRAVDPKLLPADTEVVFSINIKQMLESELAKQYKDLLDQGRGALEGQLQNNPAAKYLEKAGFDVMRDVHSITVAVNGNKDPESGIIVIEGKFDVEKIHGLAEEFARDSGELVKIGKIGSTKIFEVNPPGGKRAYAAVLNSKTIVACGSEATLKAAISGSNRGMKDTVKALLKTTSNKQSINFVGTGSAIGKLLDGAPIPNVDVVAQQLQSLEGLSVALTLGKDLTLQLGVNSKDEETAKDLAQKANGGLLLVRTLVAQQAKQNEQLQPLVEVAKTIRVSSEGLNVLVRAEISAENLEKLIKNLPKNFNR